MEETLIVHGFKIEIKSDETGAGFDIVNSQGEVFGSEWGDDDTFESAKESGIDYANHEYSRSGKDGVAA